MKTKVGLSKVLLFFYLALSLNESFAEQAKNDYYFPKKPMTKLSEAAVTLKIGMTQGDVISRLGKPSWVILPKEKIDLSITTDPDNTNLLWQNGSCNPVVVAFKNQRVVGIDEGRIICYKKGSYPKENLPGIMFMCTGDRAKYCR